MEAALATGTRNSALMGARPLGLEPSDMGMKAMRPTSRSHPRGKKSFRKFLPLQCSHPQRPVAEGLASCSKSTPQAVSSRCGRALHSSKAFTAPLPPIAKALTSLFGALAGCIMGGGDSLDKFMSRTGSSRGVLKQNGEIIAVAHPVMKKSYASNTAGGSEVATSTMRGSFTDPRRKAPLMKYHPNALRNRLPVEFKDAAIPCVRFCHPRNDHTYDIFNGNKEVSILRTPTGPWAVPRWRRPFSCLPSDVSPASPVFAQAGYQRFRTTAQNYYAYYPVPVGESNQGIVSEMAKVIHKKQSM